MLSVTGGHLIVAEHKMVGDKIDGPNLEMVPLREMGLRGPATSHARIA